MKNRLFFFLVVSLLAWPGTSYGQAKAAWQIEWDKTVEGAKDVPETMDIQPLLQLAQEVFKPKNPQ
jgi:hypothetical protein